VDSYEIKEFLATVWAIGILCGVSRSIHNGTYRSWTHCGAVGFVSGFLALGIVSILANDIRSSDFNPVYYIGVSIIIGLAGPENTKIISLTWQTFIGRMTNNETQRMSKPDKNSNMAGDPVVRPPDDKQNSL
jgi:hypothetical protein